MKHVLCPKGSTWALVEAGTGFQALELLQRLEFDVVLVDLSLPGMNGLELIRRIKTEYSGPRMLVLSMHAEEQYALRAFKAGADGYVTKDTAGTVLVDAVRKVAGGVGPMSPKALPVQSFGTSTGHRRLLSIQG